MTNLIQKEKKYMKSSVWFSVISFVMILHLSSFVLAQDNKTVEAPTVKVGDSYKFETENISNTKLSYISVREITEINGNRMTVVTTNEKSGSKRTNYYDLAWGYLGSGVDGKDGVSLSPALKYLDFPLIVGKKWTAQSVETDNKTKHQRYHTINGTVEGWEKVTVPAGEFDALKIVLNTEVKDGDKVNIGNDISWYVPALKRSIKSELTGKDASTGIEEKKNIRLLSYNVEPDYDEDNPDTAAVRYLKLLKGKRLILEGATCAGMEFKANAKGLFMYAEMECSRGIEPTLEANIKWLTSNLFVAIEKDKIQENCPPRNWLYEIQNISGDKITIKEFWTGWGDSKDDISQYTITTKKSECLRSEPYIPAGWCQPTESDYNGDWSVYRKEVPNPFHIIGYFDGDTNKDEAWILFDESREKWGIFIFIKQSDKKYKPVKIREYKFADLLPQTIQLRRVDPGEYETEGEPAKVTLKTHGFMIGAYDKGGTSLIYWNDDKFGEVLLDD